MKTLTRNSRNVWMFAAVLLLALAVPATAGPITYQVTIDTSSISGGSGYFLDLQLNPGDPSSQPLTALISLFDLGGGSLAGLPSVIGDVTGTLPASLTFVNDSFLNDYYQGFTAGASITFLLTLSGLAIDSPNGTATAGSSFGVSLYDVDNNPILTSDPGGLLGQINLGLDGQPTVLTNPAQVVGGPSAITFTPQEQPPSSVPEPATAVLLCSAAAALIIVKRFRP